MYNEVSIAPARRLGQARTSINDIPHLPLGSNPVQVSQKFNDDTTITETRNTYIADPVERNKNYTDDQRLSFQSRSLVGKKSSEMPTSTFDTSIMNKFNKKQIANQTAAEVRDRKLSCLNLVSFPFTQAVSYEFPPCQR